MENIIHAIVIMMDEMFSKVFNVLSFRHAPCYSNIWFLLFVWGDCDVSANNLRSDVFGDSRLNFTYFY